MQLTTLAGVSQMHDRGVVVGRIVNLDDNRYAALIRHSQTDELLVIGV